MIDLRARLVDALREKYGGMEFADQLGFPRDAYEILDVLLSLPGIAIVELPEPSYVDEPDPKGYGFNGGPADTQVAAEHGVYAHDGLVYDQYDGLTPTQARTVASWWLAAADAAERGAG